MIDSILFISSFYCLCTDGYQGTDCRTIDSCAYNPCQNNGVCQQLSSTGDFICQCLPNHSGTLCETLIDICQMNRSLCLSNDELQYFVFDYLKDSKNFDVINDKNFPKQFEDFIRKNLFPIENIVLSERKILGPGKYNRAELLSVGVRSSNATLNDALEIFCTNQSLISKIEKVFFSCSSFEIKYFSRFICT